MSGRREGDSAVPPSLLASWGSGEGASGVLVRGEVSCSLDSCSRGVVRGASNGVGGNCSLSVVMVVVLVLEVERSTTTVTAPDAPG